MTHSDILLLLIALLGACGIAFIAFILHEALIDLEEIKTMLEER